MLKGRIKQIPAQITLAWISGIFRTERSHLQWLLPLTKMRTERLFSKATKKESFSSLG
jgi:hypothetical protein